MPASVLVSKLPRPEIQRLYNQLLAVSARWPKDPIRADQDFHTALKHRVESELGPLLQTEVPATPSAATTTTTSSSAKIPTKVNTATTTTATLKPAGVANSTTKTFDSLTLEQLESDIRAFELLLENSYQTKFPLSDNLLKPKSQPTIYSEIIQRLDAAAINPPKPRNFFQRWFKLF
ncbi:hypothetical protein BJ085DRAFT_33369 [Dimargaris cristalligena]|uniref:Uncharacterized protein n=1 Tax=Dimargaris cristalligena TaxID=215637 RepID=A0A4P9ZQJ3_9FUNG|nr:hypothetical protein BJ085DRAFT_33369 [Dimargaris cristalligena]|eukprot:RKP35683.1 hypothetical protein BJ085DRAFT_33369 [Dimargaris cristalligena]